MEQDSSNIPSLQSGCPDKNNLLSEVVPGHAMFQKCFSVELPPHWERNKHAHFTSQLLWSKFDKLWAHFSMPLLKVAHVSYILATTATKSAVRQPGWLVQNFSLGFLPSIVVQSVFGKAVEYHSAILFLVCSIGEECPLLASALSFFYYTLISPIFLSFPTYLP